VKKLIAMIATVAVVLSMGVTALAAPAVDKYTKSPEAEEEKIAASIVGHDDVIVEIEEIGKGEMYKEYEDKLADKVADGQIARVFQIYVDGEIKVEDGKIVYNDMDSTTLARISGGAFEVAFTFNDADLVTAVYVFDNGEWEALADDAWWIEDGKVIVKTADNGAFLFVITPADSEAADSEEAKKAEDKKKSAATGYNSTAYIVCAIALAAGAAFFFGTSKKSAKEMM
jgi:hypothetical protein